MGFLWFIVAVAVFMAIGWVVDKLGGFALVGVNRGLFFRGEYKEGAKLRAGFTIHTSASVPDVMRELDTYVCAVEAPLGFDVVLYGANRTERGIAWVYGSASKTKFEAIVAFSPADDGAGTDAIFTVTRWVEEDGLVEAADALKALEMQVEAAFRAADPAALITQGTAPEAELGRFDGVFDPTD